MNTTHIHLLLNHFPVIGILIGSGLLFWGIFRKQDNIKAIAAAVLALMAIIAIPVYLTGEPAEESVEKIAGISKNMIEQHEESAGLAIWLTGITGLASLVAMIFAWQKRKTTNIIFIFTFALSIISFAAMVRTGYYGGQIRHTEIGSSNASDQQIDKTDRIKEKEANDKD